jgi:CxxC motif-containing protein
MEKRELTCIGCPLGCPITVTIEQSEVIAVTGNTCPRGEAYARKEVTNPTRIVTSTVRVVGGTSAMVSCKTKEDVPKSKIFDVIEALRDVSVPAPVVIGDVLVRNVAGTKTDIVATKNVAVSSPE